VVATDRDRFARVLDKRFKPVAYAIRTGENAVVLACDYLERRSDEASRDILPAFRTAFRDADRVLTRDAPLLPGVPDPNERRIRERGRLSEPLRRLAEAFMDVRNGTCGDLAEALARRETRWMGGNLEAYDEWSDTRKPFKSIEADVIAEMARRARKKYLDRDEETMTVGPRREQADIANDLIPAF
jgi:hypothetical protein